MRTLSIGGALGALVILLAACGGSPASSSELGDPARTRTSTRSPRSSEKWHQATSTHDIDLMMSLWAEDATFTVEAGRTLTGKDAIRAFWLAAPVFQPENHLGVGDAGLQAPRHGERRQGHAVLRVPLRRPGRRRRSSRVAGADQQVARINGEWLITNNVGAAPILAP